MELLRECYDSDYDNIPECSEFSDMDSVSAFDTTIDEENSMIDIPTSKRRCLTKSRYTSEFKTKVVEEFLQQKTSMRKLAIAVGVDAKSFRRWKGYYQNAQSPEMTKEIYNTFVAV